MTDTFRAVYSLVDPNKRMHSFEVDYKQNNIKIDIWIRLYAGQRFQSLSN